MIYDVTRDTSQQNRDSMVLVDIVLAGTFNTNSIVHPDVDQQHR
jgi:hypothetical protein